ncbi:hypothetical protein Ciccas_003685 [Cichlidogyrus casuarinus]|uniref:Uncharacterized protein n=1 Tax=Cichlidogyrus casuarinus TaxID=1844966 RepID=A0ABD2QDM1_9PLAT
MKAKEEPRRQVRFEAVMFVILGLYYMPYVSRFQSITEDEPGDKTVNSFISESKAAFLDYSTKDKVVAILNGDTTKIMQLQEVCKKALKLMLSERVNSEKKLDAYKEFSKDARKYLADAGALFEEPYKYEWAHISKEFEAFNRKFTDQTSLKSAQKVFIDEVCALQDEFLKNEMIPK